jgi:hypothetical protein
VRLVLALLAMLVAAGCTTHADAGSTAASRGRPAKHAEGGCLADWNSAANRAAREETVPPAGPYPLYRGRPRASASGVYQVFVQRSIVLGAVGTDPPPVCYVYFRLPHGYHGRPAMVSYPEIRPKAGAYGDPSITVGNDTDVEGRIFAQRPDGTLFATDRSRS